METSHDRANAEGVLTMNDGAEIEVSRRRKTEVMNALRDRQSFEK